MVSLTVESIELARGISNALAFTPANSPLPHIYLRVRPDTGSLMIVGTDGYAAGVETLRIKCEGLADPAGWLIPRGRDGVGAVGFERAVRMGARGAGTLTLGSGCLEWAPAAGDLYRVELSTVRDTAAYEHVIDLVESPRGGTGLAVDPNLLARLARVKADIAFGRMADFLFSPDELDPVLVRIGPNFRSVIMPIDRAVNAANVGQEGLW